ncbi:MAG: sulfatase-like hydrolase/transferase [Chitinivibrionales bacterium]|nr:sulfatase-like hydrolase/transferase [Chitinivibrionales bacterium]
MHRRDFLRLGAAGLASTLAYPAWGRPALSNTPNVVLIFTDDQGYGDLSCFGSTTINTPYIDTMADEGVKFTDFLVASSVCSPSRTALLTGCYPCRVGVKCVFDSKDDEVNGLHPDEFTMAEMFKQQGYATACIGKWHLGHKEPFLPIKQGFDFYYGIPYSHDMSPRILMRNEEVISSSVDISMLTQNYTTEALDFITANKDNPFFLYLPHSMPHTPCDASPAFKGKSAGGSYGDACEEIDWSTGQILQKLKDLGIERNTLVIFTSDNGPSVGSAGPLSEGKRSAREGGHREPCVMWWPGTIQPATVSDELLTAIDLLPSFASIIGATLPADREIDGIDASGLILHPESAKSPREWFLYYRFCDCNLSAIRYNKWKCWPNTNELYDLGQDIGESTDVRAANQALYDQIKSTGKAMYEEIKANARPIGNANDITATGKYLPHTAKPLARAGKRRPAFDIAGRRVPEKRVRGIVSSKKKALLRHTCFEKKQ